MKVRTLFLNITIGFAAFFFGLAWIDVFDYFLDREAEKNQKSRETPKSTDQPNAPDG